MSFMSKPIASGFQPMITIFENAILFAGLDDTSWKLTSDELSEGQRICRLFQSLETHQAIKTRHQSIGIPFTLTGPYESFTLPNIVRALEGFGACVAQFREADQQRRDRKEPVGRRAEDLWSCALKFKDLDTQIFVSVPVIYPSQKEIPSLPT